MLPVVPWHLAQPASAVLTTGLPRIFATFLQEAIGDLRAKISHQPGDIPPAMFDSKECTRDAHVVFTPQGEAVLRAALEMP